MSTVAQPAVDHAPLLERCFLFDAVEDSYEVTGIEGRIPSWMRGSYYVNGPARFRRAGLQYKHWLDGDGMVCSLRFTDDGVRFTNRFVRTPKLLEEEAAGAPIYRGFGTAFEGDKLRRQVMLEPPVNVAAYRYDGRLLAFGEQSLPYDLDPYTLETRGEYDFRGKLNEVTPFAAHAKFDGHLMNFGVQFSANKPTLNVYEFDDAGAFVGRRRLEMPYAASVHDFGFTPDRIVFFIAPLIMDFGKFWGGVSVMESLSWEPERGARILIAPRHEKGETISIEAGRGYCLHLINCFEEGSRLYCDILELDEPVYSQYQPVPDMFTTVAPCRPVRFVVDLETKQLVERIAMPYDRTPDFPALDPHLGGRRYNDYWMLGISAAGQPGRKFFDQLAHGSWKHGDVCETWQAPRGEYLGGEPVCVVNPDNREEAVIVLEHLMPAQGRGEFLLFDAFAVKNGPIARLPLKHPIHPGFHTSFTHE